MNTAQTSECFDYSNAEYENVPCDLCGSTASRILNSKDRNNLPVTSRICVRCGLIYVSPRMTQEWYDLYYQHEYREQMARFRNKALGDTFDCNAVYQKAFVHGEAIAELLKKHVADVGRIQSVIDIGSNVGGVLAGMASRMDVAVRGLEPSKTAAEFARAKGVATDVGLIEDFSDNMPRFSAVISTQSLNHYLSPKVFFEWANKHLVESGILFVEVMDFRHVWKMFGWMQRAIQIDHVHMFVEETLVTFVEMAGFDIVYVESPATTKKLLPGLRAHHLRLIAKKADRKCFPGNVQGALPYNLYNSVSSSFEKMSDSKFRFVVRSAMRKGRKLFNRS